MRTDFVKSEIRDFVMSRIEEKLERVENFHRFSLEASREIKKTPKYDSIREEIQEEIYQLQKHVVNLRELRKKMQKVIRSNCDTIQLGSLVITNKARFYISVSLGEFFFEGERMYAISEESPMYKIMLGKNIGDSFSLNGIHQTIEKIF